MTRNILFLEQFSNISGGQRVLLSLLGGIDKNKYTAYVAIPAKGELSSALDKLGFESIVVTLGAYSAGKKNILDLLQYILRSIILIPATFRVIKKYKIDIVYANAPRTFLWGTIAAKLAGISVIWHLHSVLSGIELKLMSKLLKRMVNKMIVVSRTVAVPFLKLDPTSEGKISVIYNGIDAEKFSHISDGKKIRAEFRIPEGNKIVGFIGQLAKWKGIEDLVNAASSILDRKKDVTFLVVGDVLFGAKRERDYKAYIVDMTRHLGIEEQVIFTGKRPDIPQILSAIDILVIPSVEPDPCPLVLFEGMASGKVIVAAAHGGPAEIIRNGIDGRLYKPVSADVLADTILDVLNNPGSASKMGEAAIKRVLSDYRLDQQIFSISNLLDAVRP